MEFIPGSIELDDSPVILNVWSGLEKSALLSQFAGVCYYRLPPLGVAEPSQRPNFVIISEGFGALLIEVVSERVDDFLEDDFWNLSNGETIPSRDILLDNFKNEVINRFSKERSLYNRQKREATLPIQSLLIFTENSKDSVENVEFFADTTIFQKAMNEGLEQILSKLVVESRPPQLLIDKAISTLESTDVYNKLRTRPTIKVLDKKNDYVEKALEVTF